MTKNTARTVNAVNNREKRITLRELGGKTSMFMYRTTLKPLTLLVFKDINTIIVALNNLSNVINALEYQMATRCLVIPSGLKTLNSLPR